MLISHSHSLPLSKKLGWNPRTRMQTRAPKQTPKHVLTLLWETSEPTAPRSCLPHYICTTKWSVLMPQLSEATFRLPSGQFWTTSSRGSTARCFGLAFHPSGYSPAFEVSWLDHSHFPATQYTMPLHEPFGLLSLIATHLRAVTRGCQT